MPEQTDKSEILSLTLKGPSLLLSIRETIRSDGRTKVYDANVLISIVHLNESLKCLLLLFFLSKKRKKQK